jgi:bifunctional non-homologous end joining protein LigD
MPTYASSGSNVSKRADASYVPGNRGLWVKTKCLNREEFVVVGWTDPER